MGFELPSGVVNTNSVYFYAVSQAGSFGPYVKQPSDQTLVTIDYSSITPPISITSTSFKPDVSSNPELVISYPQTNVAANVLTFLVSGGIIEQQYNVGIIIQFTSAGSPLANREDTLIVSIPSLSECAPINPVPQIYNQLPLGDNGYVNTGIRIFWGMAPPANPSALDQWYDTSNQTLYEWVTDGTEYFWDIIASPNYVMDAPLDGQLYSRMSGGWTPTPIQSDAPSALIMYVRQQGMWVVLPPQAIATDAVHDGQLYGRLNGAWVLAYPAGNPLGFQTAVQIAALLGGFMPLTGGSFSGDVHFQANAILPNIANLQIGGGAAGNQLVTNGAGVLSWNAPPGYVLPQATTTILGGVKVDGTTVTISGAGVISAQAPPVVISATAPVAPSAGLLWWDTVGGQMYLWYVDVNSSQWVPVVNQAGAGGGGGVSPSNTVAPVVSGTGIVGQALTCSQGSWAGLPTSYAYQWVRNGLTITGATTNGYTLQTADASATITCQVTATNATGSGSATSNGITVAAIPPVNTAAPVVSGTGTVGQTLTTTNGTWSNVPTSFTYQWQRDGVAISGATAGTYLLVGADATHLIGCVVTAINTGGSASSTSNAISIAPVIPANTVAPVVTGTGALGQTLTTTNGSWTNSPTGFAYQWLRNGANITGATASSYVLVSADVSTSVSCKVTASNAFGSGNATSNAIAVVAAPTNSVAPVVSGTPNPGSTLTTTNGTWSGSPTFTYQWLRNGANIAGATASTYLLVTADASNSVSCAVTATNAGGSASATSNALAITVVPPANSVAPVVSGTAYINQVLTTTNGTWSGSPTFTYQWLRDGVNITGATANTYTTVAADTTHSVSCSVTGTNAGGSATAGSNSIAVPALFKLPAGASAVYSLRQVGNGYVTNKCVNVYRFSDGVTQDIGFDANGMCDMAAAATFAGGAILCVMKWYDQSGNGRDAIQSNAISAPQLFNFNGPQISFANLDVLTTAAPVTLTGDQTIGMFCQVNCNNNGSPLECWDTSNGWAIYLNGTGAGNVSTIYDGNANGFHDSSNLLAASVHQIAITRASGAGKIFVDGAQTATGSPTNGASTGPLCIGSYQGGAFPFHGLISEIYLYASALTPTQIAAINANEVIVFPQTGFQNYYNGTTALQFGQANYLLFGNVLNYEYTQPFTLYAAVQSYSTSGGAEGGIGADIDHNTGPVFCGWLVSSILTGASGGFNPPGAPCVRLIHNLNTNQHLMVEGQETLCTGKYRLLTVTYDGSGVAAGVKLYIDGVLKTTSVISDTLGGLSIKDGTQIFSVGGQANDGGNMVNGRVGFFQIDKNVATQTYITNNFSTANPGPPPLIGGTTDIRLLMNEGSGTTVHDTSGNNNNGTLTSAAMWTH